MEKWETPNGIENQNTENRNITDLTKDKINVALIKEENHCRKYDSITISQ